MDPELQRDIASKGGIEAHASGNAYEWDSEQAAAAGSKGGREAARRKRERRERRLLPQ
jgi:general stress protein YciG